MADRPPHEIARETLQLLTSRKLPPTPENYQKIFHEVAGTARRVPFPIEELKLLSQGLPARTPGQVRQIGLLDSAINRLSWDGVRESLFAYGTYTPTAEPASASGSSGGNSGFSSLDASGTAAGRSGGQGAPALTQDFLEQIARLIEYARPALGEDDTRFTEQTQELLQNIRQPDANVPRVKSLLSNFGLRLSFAAEDQAAIKSTLLHLLHLIIQNIGELSLDDRWLKGQIDALMVASAPPLTLRRLDDVERRLKDVIFKQTEAKGRALEAQEEMRLMLATFIQRLSQMAESSASFQGKMEDSARLIEQAKSIIDLTPVMKDVIGATRSMAADSMLIRDELRGMREKAQATDAQIARLHEELDRVSVQARHDPLTGVLNRKGLDEALAREVANVRRKDTPLCIAMLDIDNFKAINDTRGHAMGDAALKHLANVARECMRPQDTLARYGGEEFIILMPDTVLEKSTDAMTRLQRELTKRLFLTGTDKLLITFSAGVAQLAPDDDGSEAIHRADQGMYLAKRSGKNRVLAAT
jgi:diguanylate cyclase